MSDPASLAAAFSREGVVLVAGVLSGAALAAVADAASSPPPGRAGTRCLLGESWCRVLAAGLRADIRLAALLPPGYVAVQCTLFEKSPARNWLVPLHQDLSIPVAERLDEAGWTGWSRKEDAWFVQAPAAVLAELVALRLHLDDCGPDDGPLRVVPGSHVHGVLPDGAAARGSVVALPAARGDVLAMRPLLQHASSKAGGTSRRRVLHLLFGPPALPHGLRWPAPA